jgi:ferredoxin-thioredoxin reductase catalytic subunit
MTEPSQAETDMLMWVQNIAHTNGWVLNPNKEHLRIVVRGLTKNKLRLGKAYCPCRIRTGNPEKDIVVECPCIYHKDEIIKDGHCHCLLFYKE